MTDNFVHPASGEQEATFIQEALRELGRQEPVFAPVDSLAEGPLHDVDAGAASRRAWYERINPDLSEEILGQLDDSELWANVRRSSGQVMLWHGPRSIHRIFALRACWHLRDQSERVYEVASRADPRGRFTCLTPKQAIQAWDTRAKVDDVSARAQQWEKIRDQPGDWIRVLEGESIVPVPVTAYDDAVIDACGGGWTRSRMVLGRILWERSVGLSLARWRIRELLLAGRLDGRGEPTELGLPDEVRPAQAAGDIP